MALNDSDAANLTTNATPPFDASCYSVSSDNENVMTSMRFFFGASVTLVVAGLIGNALSVVVFSSREMRQMSSNVYLLALAVSDSLYLVSVFLGRLLIAARCWYFPAAALDFVNRSAFFCVLLQYLSDLFADCSTCLILAFTVERGLAVFYPVVFKQSCTVWRARLVCAAMFAFIAVVIAPYHVIMIGLYADYHVCAIVSRHEEAFAVAYVVELVTLRVLPVVAIALLNALIVARVSRITRDKNRRRLHVALRPVTGGGDTAEMNGRRRSADGSAASFSGGRRSRRKRPIASSASPRRVSLDERNLQLTIILILVSSTYVLFYLPVLIHFILMKMERSAILHVGYAFLDVFGNYAKALHVAGFAINFLLYTLSGRVFREQLLALLCPGCKSAPSGYMRPAAAAGTTSTNIPDAM